jgi:3-hydroxy-3-methylglutaryl CoA synthase
MEKMRGIVSIGTYLPRLRMARSAMAEALGWLMPGMDAKGYRALGYWDENSTTMGVEAARAALKTAAEPVSRLALVTTSPVFVEPQNAATIHRALALPRTAPTQDISGAGRGCLTAMIQMLEGSGASLIVAADRCKGPAGSVHETRYSDGAAAAVIGNEDPIFEYLAGADLTSAFIDRYRVSGRVSGQGWEERWVREEGILKQVPIAIADALSRAVVEAGQVRHFVFPSILGGIGAALARTCGLSEATAADNLVERCGNIGSGHALAMLAHAAETMAPGDLVVVAAFGQGASALVLRRTSRELDDGAKVTGQLEAGIVDTNYLRLPLYGGMLEWERGLRGRAVPGEALSTLHRNEDALLGFLGERDIPSGEVRFPPTGRGEVEPWPLADRRGRIASFAADLLAFSPSPPSCYGLIDFDGGGRLMMDVTDPDAASLQVGDAVRFVFRIHDSDPATGYVRYFWKAIGTGQDGGQDG